MDYAPQRSRNEIVALQGQQSYIINRLGIRKAGHRASLLAVFEYFVDRQPFRVVNPAAHIVDRHDLHSHFVEELRRVAANIAEALNRT